MQNFFSESLLDNTRHPVDQIPPGRSLDEDSGRLAVHMKVSIELTHSERKPYSVRIEGPFVTNERLSPIRAAILLVLLLDLQDRVDGGPGCPEPLAAMVSAYRQLDPTVDSLSGDAPALVRTALHRFARFLEDSKSFESRWFSLRMNRDELRLELHDREANLTLSNLSVAIESSSSSVRQIVERSFACSPMLKVKKMGTAYLAGGEGEHDRFFRELFDHKHPVESWGTFERLSVQSLPSDLLRKAQVSESRREQARLMHEGFAEGRCRFTEIHNSSTLWDCIRCSEEDGFKLYPSNFSSNDVRSHLEHVIHLLKSFSSYSLHLTEVPIPFHVVTTRVFANAVPDCFTVFIPRFNKEAIYRVSSFVVYDMNLSSNVIQNMIGGLHTFPNTVSDRAAVIKRIESVLAHLKNKGPLGYSAEPRGSLSSVAK